MSGPPKKKPSSGDATKGNENAAPDIPILSVDPGASGTRLPKRRAPGNQGLARAEPGLRIGAREVRLVPVDAEGPASKLEINRLSAGVVRLESVRDERPEFYHPLPVMVPRAAIELNDTSLTQEWGNSPQRSHRWLWWGAGAVVLAIVAGLLLQFFLEWKRDSRPPGSHPNPIAAEAPVAVDEPTVYFSDHLEEVEPQMRAALTAYARARTPGEVIPFIRDGEKLRPELEKEWKPWRVPPDWQPEQEVQLGYSSVGILPYGIIDGTLPDFQHYQVYLVREGDRMVVDWEATIARGSVEFSDLPKPDVHAAVLRGKVSPVAFYSLEFPEAGYQCYRFEKGIGENPYIWVYARRGTSAAGALDSLFHTGPILEGNTSPQPVKLNLVHGDPSTPRNQWLVRDVLHKGWVSP